MNRLLDHYNEELRYLRQDGAQFARQNPQVASRLGLHPDAITDPFVERLLEGVAFLSARVHSRMDRESAEFAQQALARVAPGFCCVTPSITTIAFQPDYRSPESQRGRSIPKGSIVQANVPGLARPVHLSTGSTVEMVPLRIGDAECVRSVEGLPNTLAARLLRTPALIRLKFEVEANAVLGDMCRGGPDGKAHGLDPISLTLGGDAPLAFGLHQALLADAEQIHVLASDGSIDHAIELPLTALRLPMDAQCTLLPPEVGGLHGLRLLREYFAQPSSFLRLELHGLRQLAQRCPRARSFEVLVGLKRQLPNLLGRVTPAAFHLFATPAINLYSRRLDPLNFDPAVSAQWLVVDRMKPSAFHLFSLTRVTAVSAQGHRATLEPVLGSADFEGAVPAGNYGLVRHAIDVEVGDRGDPLSTHDRLVLSIQDDAVAGPVTSVQMEGLVCDRGWRPEQLLQSSLSLAEPMGVSKVECLWLPSTPRALPDLARCWEAVAFLGESPLATASRSREEPLAALKRWIALAADVNNPLDLQRIAGLRAMRLSSALTPCASTTPVGWIHTMKALLDISNAHHADRGAWLFGRVVAQALAQCVHLNEGLEIELCLDGHVASKHSNLLLQDGRFT